MQQITQSIFQQRQAQLNQSIILQHQRQDPQFPLPHHQFLQEVQSIMQY